MEICLLIKNNFEFFYLKKKVINFSLFSILIIFFIFF